MGNPSEEHTKGDNTESDSENPERRSPRSSICPESDIRDSTPQQQYHRLHDDDGCFHPDHSSSPIFDQISASRSSTFRGGRSTVTEKSSSSSMVSITSSKSRLYVVVRPPPGFMLSCSRTSDASLRSSSFRYNVDRGMSHASMSSVAVIGSAVSPRMARQSASSSALRTVCSDGESSDDAGSRTIGGSWRVFEICYLITTCCTTGEGKVGTIVFQGHESDPSRIRRIPSPVIS